jgi:hypothetical protein
VSKIDINNETEVMLAIITEVVHNGGEGFDWLDAEDIETIKEALYQNRHKPGPEWLEVIVGVIEAKIEPRHVRKFLESRS